MSDESKKADIQARVDTALEQRLRGNESFKKGELQSALVDYHHVLLQLKGLESALQAFDGPPPPITQSAELPKEEGIRAQVKQGLLSTHLNMAAILVKQQKWKRALEAAQQAQKIDSKNDKAQFREAQARCGLGEVTKGKKMLNDMYERTKDPAILAALKQLEIEDKNRSAKADSAFRGMYNKKGSTSGTSGPSSATPPAKGK